MRTPRHWVVPALAVLVLLPGCATLSGLFKQAFKEPSVRFKRLNLREVSLSEVTLDTVWELKNPNPIGLSLAQVDYKFFVEGHQVVAGRPPNGLRVAPNGRTDLQFPTQLKFADLAPALKVFLEKDVAQYRAEGTVGIKTPIGILRFPLANSGTFEVPKVPQISLQPPKITSIDLRGAKLELPIVLTNRNSFALPIAGLSGGVSIAGAQVGNIATGDLGALAGKASQTVTLPLQINFASALSAANAIRQGRANVALNGQLQSGSGAVPVNVAELLNFVR